MARLSRTTILVSLLAVAGLVIGVCAATLGHDDPAAKAPRGDVIAQLFEWRWVDVAAECRGVLGPDGYGAVQISPPQEAVVRADSGYPWWEAYQPVSYRLTSRFGTEAQLRSMIATCHAAGVRVYADAVLNHMSGQDGGIGDTGTRFPGKYDYPGLYSVGDFHNCHNSIQNWDDTKQVWNCQLDGLADLDTGTPHVRAAESAYLNSLISLGVDGFRIDAAKNMSPSDIAGLESKLSRKVFVYQEVAEVSGQPVVPSLYQDNGHIEEFRFGAGLRDAFESGHLDRLRGYGSAGMEKSTDAVSFVDDQDTERDGTALSYADGANYTLANVFLLAWDYGTPEIMSDYRFTGRDQGPPGAGGNRIGQVDCGHGWECEQRWPQIAGMVGWHNAATGQPVTHWWSDGGDAIAFGRGARGFVAINAGGSPVTRTFATGLPAGRYCDVVHGGCSVITVNAGGQARIDVAAHDAAGIDVDRMS